MNPSIYTMKVNPDHLEGARKFFSRINLPLQESLRAQMKMASDCERCLELVEANAPVEQVQSAFASILDNAKETWHLNGIFREVIMKTAEICKLPQEFINNVMTEAERINSTKTKERQTQKRRRQKP
ncbi:MAG: hypothetical protein PHU23_09630 [Dehalococcoidales bacterium]|nr:hypothetical protein [Dehalococcoidales bacterium]